MYLVSANGNALLSRSEAIVENCNTTQMRDIFLQDAKGVGMGFKPENVGVGELPMKINNGSTNVAPDIENDLRSEGRRHVILRFLPAPEENLIQNRWIFGT